MLANRLLFHKIMNVRQKLESMLVANGMLESQAIEVMDLAIPEINKLDANYTVTFNSKANDYPDYIYSLLFLNVKPFALKWIDDNKPEAWFRTMFV